MRVSEVVRARAVTLSENCEVIKLLLHTGLKVLNNWPTFPQLIVNGELVGGLDIVREMIKTGEFADVLKAE